MTFPLAAGDEPTADQLNDIAEPGWTSYTPTWTANTGTPAIGNGTLSGRYRRTGGSNQILFEFVLTAGTTTTFGTSFWLFTVPAVASTDSVSMSTGTARLLDAGTVSKNGCASFFTTTQIVVDSPTGVVSNASPHTWATTDSLRVQISYEAA